MKVYTNILTELIRSAINCRLKNKFNKPGCLFCHDIKSKKLSTSAIKLDNSRNKKGLRNQKKYRSTQKSTQTRNNQKCYTNELTSTSYKDLHSNEAFSITDDDSCSTNSEVEQPTDDEIYKQDGRKALDKPEYETTIERDTTKKLQK